MPTRRGITNTLTGVRNTTTATSTNSNGNTVSHTSANTTSNSNSLSNPNTNGNCNSNSNRDDPKLSDPSSSSLPYTAEERAFLSSLSASSISENLTNLNATWASGTGLDRLIGVTEKVLAMAAERHQAEYHQSRKTTTSSSSHLGRSGRESDPLLEENSGKSGGGPGLNPTTAATAMEICGVSSFSSPLTPVQFEEENAYIIEQLRELLECPFTIQRLVEILENPFKHYGSAKDCMLRAEALQKAIRRCVMVTYPFTVINDNDHNHEKVCENNSQNHTESCEATTTPTTKALSNI
ncbi:unnamed protein product [Phytomonas sp. Hart1]|nr:unnamed protein product [Phytomonas sp. Hart1]|eukprot:CCW70934.1 unnamed protein product [Phytomonas sp. isolate Hart1]